MTKEMMDVQALLGKSADSDFLREMIGFAAQRLMELEVGGLTGAAGAQSGRPSAMATAIGIGRRGPERSNCASPSCAPAAISPASWSPAGWRRRR